jgi:hypothetical protein
MAAHWSRDGRLQGGALVELGDKLRNAALDLVALGPYGVERLSCRALQLPVDLASPGM